MGRAGPPCRCSMSSGPAPGRRATRRLALKSALRKDFTQTTRATAFAAKPELEALHAGLPITWGSRSSCAAGAVPSREVELVLVRSVVECEDAAVQVGGTRSRGVRKIRAVGDLRSLAAPESEP